MRPTAVFSTVLSAAYVTAGQFEAHNDPRAEPIAYGAPLLSAYSSQVKPAAYAQFNPAISPGSPVIISEPSHGYGPVYVPGVVTTEATSFTTTLPPSASSPCLAACRSRTSTTPSSPATSSSSVSDQTFADTMKKNIIKSSPSQPNLPPPLATTVSPINGAVYQISGNNNIFDVNSDSIDVDYEAADDDASAVDHAVSSAVPTFQPKGVMTRAANDSGATIDSLSMSSITVTHVSVSLSSISGKSTAVTITLPPTTETVVRSPRLRTFPVEIRSNLEIPSAVRPWLSAFGLGEIPACGNGECRSYPSTHRFENHSDLETVYDTSPTEVGTNTLVPAPTTLSASATSKQRLAHKREGALAPITAATTTSYHPSTFQTRPSSDKCHSICERTVSSDCQTVCPTKVFRSSTHTGCPTLCADYISPCGQRYGACYNTCKGCGAACEPPPCSKTSDSDRRGRPQMTTGASTKSGNGTSSFEHSSHIRRDEATATAKGSSANTSNKCFGLPPPARRRCEQAAKIMG